jgi:hypothetical protein
MVKKCCYGSAIGCWSKWTCCRDRSCSGRSVAVLQGFPRERGAPEQSLPEAQFAEDGFGMIVAE